MEEAEMDSNGDGGGFLPRGFVFDPRNQEAVVEYLRNRVSGRPFPFDQIRTKDVYSTEPWNLIPRGKTEVCYFSPIVRHGDSRRPSRKAGDGSWTANGKTVVVVDGQPVARKQLLSFHCKGTKKSSGFVMHEYELTEGPDDLVFCWIKANAQLEKQLKRKNNWGCQDHQGFMEEPPSRRPRLSQFIAEPSMPSMMVQPMFDHPTASSAITCHVDGDTCEELAMQHQNGSRVTWCSLMQFMVPVLAQQVQLGIFTEHQQQHLVEAMRASYLEQQQSACPSLTTSSPDDELEEEQRLCEQETIIETERCLDSVTLSVPGLTEEEKQFNPGLSDEDKQFHLANGSNFDLDGHPVNTSDFELHGFPSDDFELQSTLSMPGQTEKDQQFHLAFLMQGDLGGNGSDFEFQMDIFDLTNGSEFSSDFELDGFQLDDFDLGNYIPSAWADRKGAPVPFCISDARRSGKWF